MNSNDDDVSSLGPSATADMVTHTTTVETATLVLPDDTLRPGDEFILQTTTEIAAATSDAPLQQGGGHVIHIEGIVDLDELRDLVPGIDEDEFATLLHTHQQANGDDDDDDDDEDNTTLLSTLFHLDEQSHLLGDIESEQQELEDVPVSADAFLETIANAMPPTEVSRANKTQTYETSNQAFLLSVPMTNASLASGEEQTLVLAMPEINESEPLIMEESEVQAGDLNEEGEEDDDEYHGFVDMVRQYSEYLPQIPSLPTDVQDVELVATHTIAEHTPSAEEKVDGEEEEEEEEEEHIAHLDLIVERKVPLIGYVILVVGLFALASVGAALDLQEGSVTATMKSYWRLQSTAICIFPIAVLSMAQTPKDKLEEQWSSLTRRDLYFDLPICAASYSLLTAAFVIALEKTNLANAFVLSNLASLVIICGKLALGIKVLLLEGTGAFIGLSGAVVCALAPPAVVVEATDRMLSTLTSNEEQIGDGIAFLCSLGTAMYLIKAKKLRYKMDLFVFMFLIFALASVFLLCYMIMTGEEIRISADPNVGLFGWTDLVPDRLPLELYMAIVCNIAGTTGYIAVMKYFDPVVITMVMLTEPAVATLLGILAGVEKLPVGQVIVGNAFVILGSIIVIASESKSTESIDATKAFTTVEDTGGTTVVRTPKLKPSHKSTTATAAGTDSSTNVIWKPS
ncbi:unnamed protein product [Cylindrotheca closterium]|uniref:EamA domain-containing protein n=1 Tax=Cylindrotheca closterium TaxID=2856 RepID=A0AAD2JQ18_9STRA|nr:unnamed protein product [Cylindrotheca closterium]